MDFSTVLTALRSIERRERVPTSLKSLAEHLRSGPFKDSQSLIEKQSAATCGIRDFLNSDLWESIAVGLLLATSYVDISSTELSDDFLQDLFCSAESNLEHSEPRVRRLVSKLLGSLASRKEVGILVFHRFFSRLTLSIESNFDRTCNSIQDRVSGNREIAVDDTTGWKALETSIVALKELIISIGAPLVEGGYISNEVINHACRGATDHVNRHVREASFGLITSIVEACGSLNDNSEFHLNLRLRFVDSVSKGLQDNWSQVRFAASVSNRALLQAMKTDSIREDHYDKLLPRMCLNRYYMAEGVKLYSQETWKLFMGTGGCSMVAKHAEAVVHYYVSMTEANNHVVREAACHSIAEMASKVDKIAVSPHVKELLGALLVCFSDESWPVRDAACVATGRFASSFPEECRAQLPLLFDKWFKHLAEPIWSVREDSAAALGQICAAYGDEASDRCIEWLKENLPKAREQKPKTWAELIASHNDTEAHTDKQRYSCGSLAPKLKKGGCSDCEVTRPSEPWEFSDGALYLLLELCVCRPTEAAELIPLAAETASLTHFPQADTLRETLWKLTPKIADVLGKKIFRRYLEYLIDPLFDTLSRPTTNQLAAHSAGMCVKELSAFMGPTIFRGRLSPEQLHIMDTSFYINGSNTEPTASSNLALTPPVGGNAASRLSI